MTISHFQSTILISKGLNTSIGALSNQISAHSQEEVATNAGVTFHPNGQVYDLGPLVANRTLFVSGEWYPNEPVTNIGAFYDIREASLFSGTTWQVQPDTLGTYLKMDVERIWRNGQGGMVPGVVTSTSLFELYATGTTSPVIASAYYTGEATVTAA